MTDTAAAPTAEVPAVQASPKKTAAKKPDHPATGEMVNAAIAALKDKKASPLQAIKKYIAAQYKVNVDKQPTFIKKYIKSSVAKKTIVQTKGSGASGSFKLAAKAEGEKKVVKKPAAAKKTVAKKSKAAVKPEEAAAKKPAKPKAAKTAKAPTKPKAPKAKKAAASKAKANPNK